MEIDEKQWNDIEKLLEQIAENTSDSGTYRGPIQDMSQSAAGDRLRSKSADDNWNFNQRKNPARQRSEFKSRKPLEQFEEGITKSLLDSISGPGGFDASMKRAMSSISKNFGTNLKDFTGNLGKEVGKQILNNTQIGNDIKSGLKNALFGKNQDGSGGIFGKIQNSSLLEGKDALKGAIKDFGNSFLGDTASLAEGANAAASGLSTAGGAMATAGTEAAAGTALAGGAMAELGSVIATIATGPALPAIVAIGAVLVLIGPALEGLFEVIKTLGGSALRSDEERAKRAEAAQKRLQADMEYLAKQPFEILTEAANEWYSAWDKNLRDISQTQGYNKESVYNLYSSFAERLKEEGLSSVISSTSIIDNLDQVLKSGLSGKAAEEFAYVATKLNNAIPTQDFFGYAASYAQIAANAISQGQSQEEALNAANQQLEQFASNLLYSSRELAGGFSTGLQNASQLFTDAVNIAQTAKTGNASAISGTLTSVSAILGAVAPDLANGLVQNIVNAAIGGNSDSIVALRSLAGINASNTEFLRAFAENPQAIFGNVFTKLAELQTMSNDNFMEVAEGLAPIFGVDMAALSRVDFNYLAQAVSQMNVNNNSLNENLSLLASGQSTTTAEQAKMAEINEIILNDGLAVVLDNAAARTIQEHMWQEQQTVALTSAEYAVNLQGAALQFLEGISQTITNIIRFLNPIGAIAEVVSNIAATGADTAEQQFQINKILQEGAIKSNNTVLSNLTNYTGSGMLDIFNEGLSGSALQGRINTRLSEMLGFGSETSTAASVLNGISNVYDTIGRLTPMGMLGAYSGDVDDALATIYSLGSAGGSSASSNAIQSGYTWNLVGKTAARLRSNWSKTGTSYSDLISASSSNDAQAAADAFSQAISDSIAQTNVATLTTAMNDATGRLESGVSFGDTQKSYEQWLSDFIASQGEGFDYQATLARYGMTEEQVRGRFQAQQASSQASVSEQRANAETAFYEDARNLMKELREFWRFTQGTYFDQYWQKFFDDNMKFDTRIDDILAEMTNIRDNWIGQPNVEGTVRGLLDTINTTLINFNNSFTDWVQEWTDYYINHTTYTARTTSAEWSELVNMEQAASRDNVLALANALEGISNLDDLMDPTVQQTALLAKIVVILEAMMQQNNSTGGLSLIDTISAMSLGLTGRG